MLSIKDKVEVKFWVKDREQPTRRVGFGSAEPMWCNFTFVPCLHIKLLKSTFNTILTEAMWANDKLLAHKKMKILENLGMNLMELIREVDRIGLSHGEVVW